jgi:peptide/nickel transport system permease protein
MTRLARIARRLDLSPSAYIGLAVVAAFLFAALVGPLIAPHPPIAAVDDLDQRFLGPSSTHWLGTDHVGADLLSQMLHGARLALAISACVVLVCAVVGTTIGVVAGYYGGWVDETIMRIVDILLAFPGILLNIAIVALVGKPGIGVLIFALSLNGWVGYARVARGQVLSLRELEYVSAARCVGCGDARIMRRYIVPNLLSPIMVMMSLNIGGVIAVEASLSFLGLGPGVEYTWGALLDQGTTFMWVTPRILLVPGIAIMLVVLGSNLLGDGLRDRLDPKRLRAPAEAG